MEYRSDICLVVEGCYPYVTGGVSSWLQWLMQNMRDLTFSVVALIAEEKSESQRKYALPSNVVSYEEYVIFDYREIEGARPARIPPAEWRRLAGRIHQLVMDWKAGGLSEGSLSLLRELTVGPYSNAFPNFLEDEEAFALLTTLYQELRGETGFLKYFYNCRNIHLILFRLLMLVPRLPRSRVYHSPSTGYGGFMACLRAAIDGARSMITEHGIYLQEREMELLKSSWLDDPYLKDMWISSFSALCRWQYNACDRLITLFEGNKRLEVEYGAREEKITVIPNGIDTARFKAARSARCTRSPRTVGLVGRVDSVKDVKTFIQAMAMIHKGYPDVKGLVVGPTDDQPEYFRECMDLVRMLHLEDTVTFTGRADVLSYYREMDVLLLTSIKEAMPLVVMEAMASGVPVVATDVGACRELLHGLRDGIGEAGIVRRIMDAEGIAEATLKILRDPDLANAYGRNGAERIEASYREELVIDHYRRIYGDLLNGGNQFSA